MTRTFVKHAWFSKKQENLLGSFEMDTPDGKVVRVTALGDNEFSLHCLEWDDGAYIGIVLSDTFRNQSFKSDFSPAKTAPIRKQLNLGDVCPVCGAEFKERLLFRTSYLGCHC